MGSESVKKQEPKTAERKLTNIEEYVYANAIFWAFLIVTAVVSYFTCGGVWDSVTSGTLEFLFVIVGGGFTLVSILDYIYEKYYAGSEQN